MKRKILITLIIGVLSTGWVYGQVRLGARGGFAVPNIIASGDNPLSTGYKSRFAGGGGIFTEFDFSKRFAIRFGVEYSGQGGKREGIQGMSTNQMFTDILTRMGTSIPAEMTAAIQLMAASLPQVFYADVKNTAKFDYLMIPISLQTDIFRAEKWKVHVNAGPFLSFLLSAEQISTGKSKLYVDANKSQTMYEMIPALLRPMLDEAMPELADVMNNGVEFGTSTITGEIKPVNIGVQGNVGVSYLFGKNHSAFVETGGNYGFVRMQKDSKNGSNRIGAFTIMLGCAFSILR